MRSCTERKETYINRQVFPQAPSPTMTSLRRISAIFTSQKARVSKIGVGRSQMNYGYAGTVEDDIDVGCVLVGGGGAEVGG